MIESIIQSQLVSVIIPAYNVESYITDSINSALGQTWSNIEVIVINDGSTDNTLKSINEFKDQITIISQENMGVSAARNNAVKQANGKWIAFLDGDDIWESEKIEKQLAQTQITKTRWSHTNSKYFGATIDKQSYRSDYTEMYHGNVFSKIILSNFITTSTILMERTLYFEYDGMNESLDALEDWELWVRIAKKHPIGYIPESLTDYRVYPGSTSRKARWVLPLHKKVIKRIFTEIVDEPMLKKLESDALRNSFSICAYIAENSNDHVYAFKCWSMAIITKPLDTQLWIPAFKSFVKMVISSLNLNNKMK